jgi:hypothetical protein
VLRVGSLFEQNAIIPLAVISYSRKPRHIYHAMIFGFIELRFIILVVTVRGKLDYLLCVRSVCTGVLVLTLFSSTHLFTQHIPNRVTTVLCWAVSFVKVRFPAGKPRTFCAAFVFLQTVHRRSYFSSHIQHWTDVVSDWNSIVDIATSLLGGGVFFHTRPDWSSFPRSHLHLYTSSLPRG